MIFTIVSSVGFCLCASLFASFSFSFGCFVSWPSSLKSLSGSFSVSSSGSSMGFSSGSSPTSSSGYSSGSSSGSFSSFSSSSSRSSSSLPLLHFDLPDNLFHHFSPSKSPSFSLYLYLFHYVFPPYLSINNHDSMRLSHLKISQKSHT